MINIIIIAIIIASVLYGRHLYNYYFVDFNLKVKDEWKIEKFDDEYKYYVKYNNNYMYKWWEDSTYGGRYKPDRSKSTGQYSFTRIGAKHLILKIIAHNKKIDGISSSLTNANSSVNANDTIIINTDEGDNIK